MTDPETFRRIGEITRDAAQAMTQTRAGQIMRAAQELDPDDAAEARSRQLERDFDQRADAELLAIIRRIRRKAEVMHLDATRTSSARADANEIRILAEMAEKHLGGEHA
jgi:hypothetical protein